VVSAADRINSTRKFIFILVISSKQGKLLLRWYVSVHRQLGAAIQRNALAKHAFLNLGSLKPVSHWSGRKSMGAQTRLDAGTRLEFAGCRARKIIDLINEVKDGGPRMFIAERPIKDDSCKINFS
jgi:hypothetical protein